MAAAASEVKRVCVFAQDTLCGELNQYWAVENSNIIIVSRKKIIVQFHRCYINAM